MLAQTVKAETTAPGSSWSPRLVKEVLTLRRLGVRQKARLLAHPRVLIQSDNGFWQAGYAGYKFAATAAEYTGADAYDATKHCGPEKLVRYHLVAEAARPAPEASQALRDDQNPSTTDARQADGGA